MVRERRQAERELADDLRPHVQRGVRVPPAVERECRPRVLRGGHGVAPRSEALRLRSSRRDAPIRLAHLAKLLVGPRHRSWSTLRNSGASVRSVARLLKRRARRRPSPRTEGGNVSIAPYSFRSRAAVTRPM